MDANAPQIDSSNLAAAKPKPRAWYRLHFSTWLVLLCGVVVALLLNIPGDERDRPDAGAQMRLLSVFEGKVIEHGYPTVYLQRNGGSGFSDTWGPWRLTSHVEEFFWRALLFDATLALAALVVLVALVERRRRRRRFLQFSLRDLLFLTAVVASILGWWNYRRGEAERLNNVLGRGCPAFPGWIRQWVKDDDLLLRFRLAKAPPTYVDWSSSNHDDVKYLVDRYPDAVVIDLSGRESDEDLDAICKLSELQNVRVSEGGDRYLLRLGRLPNLRTLCLNYGAWVSSFFADGNGETENTALSGADNNRIDVQIPNPAAAPTDRGLAALANCTHLEFLALGKGHFTDEGLSHLRKLARLEVLALQSGSFTDKGLENLREMPRLRMLSLPGSSITDAGAERICDFVRLQFLGLGNSQITDVGLRRIAALPRLMGMDLGETSVSDGAVAEVRRRIDVDCETERNTLDQLKNSLIQIRASKTQTLEIASDRIHDEQLMGLSDCMNLRSLALDSKNVTDATLARIANLPELEALDLSRSSVTGRGLKSLAKMPKLQQLALNVKQLDDAGLEALRQLDKSESHYLGVIGSEDPVASRKLAAKLDELPGWVVEGLPMSDPGQDDSK